MRVGFHWVMGAAMCALCIAAAGSEAVIEDDGGSSTIQGERRIWIEPGTEQPDRRARLLVTHGTEYRSGERIVFECAIETEHYLDISHLRLDILDGLGESIHQGSLSLDLGPGTNPARFTWEPVDLPPGTYRARFELSRFVEGTLTGRELIIRHLDDRQLAEAIEAASLETAELRAHLDRVSTLTPTSPYVQLRMTIAEDFIRDARDALHSGDWRWADALTQYITSACHRIRAELTFTTPPSLRRRPMTLPSLDALAVDDTMLTAENQPVFLVGAQVELPLDIAHLKQYGMNLAVLDMGPGRMGLFPDEELAAFFDAAETHNVAVAPLLRLDRLFPISADYSWGQALEAVQLHLDTVAPRLGHRSMLGPIELASEPRFRFEGPDIRDSFVRHMEAEYETINALNVIWRSRLSRFGAIRSFWEFEPDSPDFLAYYTLLPAYQYDWQRFHQRLGTVFLQRVADAAQTALPNALLHVGLTNDAFEPTESSWGVDREALTQLFSMVGATAHGDYRSPVYALGHPYPAIYISLLRSLAPDKPMVNLRMNLEVDAAPHSEDRFGQAYSMLWSAAIHGVDAIAIADPLFPTDRGGVFSMPEVVEATGTASLDLNRLAPIVSAIQEAPADVSILWSMPSKILDDGTPYLSSVVNAYEGISFFGWNVGFISEAQCVAGGLADVPVLVLPEMLSLSDEAFHSIIDYLEEGGVVVRWGRTIPYNARGLSRQDVLPTTDNTIMLRGEDAPINYLHAMDAAFDRGAFEVRPRLVNRHEYPLEGVISRSVDFEGDAFLYVVNLRQEPVFAYLFGAPSAGHDLIQDRPIRFPAYIDPLQPKLIRLAPSEEPEPDWPEPEQEEETPTAVVGPTAPPLESPYEPRRPLR